MRILFICPSQEPGRCGVGDYTHRLAEACADFGITCAIIALKDKASLPTGSEKQRSRDRVSILRLPCSVSRKYCLEQAKAFVKDFAPDWISLQFVPYGYHPKGFPWGLGPFLNQIAAGAKRHVFFHELTLGLHREERLVNRFNGLIQQACLRRFLRYWKPTAIQTHTAPYLAELKQMGHSAECLPLFGNIPIAPVEPVHPDFDAWVEQRSASGRKFLLAGYFGSFYPGAANAGFLARLEGLAEKMDRQIVCCLAGQQTPEALARWQQTTTAHQRHLKWCMLGTLSEQQVSSYLQQLDFGIAATPYALIGKSGSAAAMRDHGLPVLVPRNDWTPKLTGQSSEVPAPDGIIPAWNADFVNDRKWLELRSEAADSRAAIADRFLATLSTK